MHEFVQRIHFIGIGGVGMSGIAEVLLREGYEVSGSDLQPSAGSERLARAGAQIDYGHAAGHIAGADVVVVSSAILDDNIERLAAIEARIPVVRRAEMLAELMRFRQGIAVAGTHGKTTTTSLIAALFSAAGLDPTVVVGGAVKALGGNARFGQGRFLVAEADESDGSFLCLAPNIAVVTNVDDDHLEAYENDFEQLLDAYRGFLRKLPFYGLAVICLDDPGAARLLEELGRPTLTYGFAEAADFRAVNWRAEPDGSYFEVQLPGESLGEFHLPLPGKHQVSNALAALGIGMTLKLPVGILREALAGFSGVGRRFERLRPLALPKGGEAELVDDYAHHPTELAATLRAAAQCWPHRRRVVVFQPHRYSRTARLLEDFARVLAGVDLLFITAVYPAGEAPIDGGETQALCSALERRQATPHRVRRLEDLPALLREHLRPEDVLLMLGAGDIGRLSARLAEEGLVA